MTKRSAGSAAADAPAAPARASAEEYPEDKGKGNLPRGPFALLSLASLGLLFVCTLSGFMMVMQEARNDGGVLFDTHALALGRWAEENVHPRAVMMHSDWHAQPTLSLAGRPSLVAYFGWVSNHGYNANERLGDRDYVLKNALKDSDEHAHFLLRRWGVRYVVGDNMPRHPRKAGADPDLYLDGKLKRVFQSGHYELFQVQGYDSLPS